ncbi:MAG: hypothetical protein QM736_15275 [Vicinamibacterales bacterium]
MLVNGVRAGTVRFDAEQPANPVVEAQAAAGAELVRIVRQGEGSLYFDAAVRSTTDRQRRKGARDMLVSSRSLLST